MKKNNTCCYCGEELVFDELIGRFVCPICELPDGMQSSHEKSKNKIEKILRTEIEEK